MTASDSTTKTCTKCHRILPATTEYFAKRPNGTLWASCKQCQREWARKHYNQTPLPDTAVYDGKKRCTKCGEMIPATREYFPPSSKGSDKLHTWCLACHRKHTWERRQNPEVRERQREYDRKRSADPAIKARKKKQAQERAKNPEVRKRQNEYSRNFYHNRPGQKEKRRIRNARRRLDPQFREQRLEYERLRRLDPEYQAQDKIRKHNRRAKKRNLPNTMTVEVYNLMMNYWGHHCAVCGKTADFWTTIAQDHWIPLSSDDCPGTIPTNIIPLCHSMANNPAGHVGCNNSKTNKPPLEWLIEQYGKRKAKQIMKRIQEYFNWIVQFD